MLFGQAAARRPSGLHRFEFFAAGNPAANFKDYLAQGNTHRNLNQPGVHYLAAKRKYLGALRFLGSDTCVPLCTVQNNLGNISKRFHIIDDRRLPPQSFNSREGRLRCRHPPVTFNGVNQGGFFSADKSPRAKAHVNVKGKAGAKNIIA
ncbi:hypothetical protein D3C81_1397610 [compost metagenome]